MTRRNFANDFLRRRRLLTAGAFGVVGFGCGFPTVPVLAGLMDNIDLASPEMTEADLTRAEVEAMLAEARAQTQNGAGGVGGVGGDFRRRRLSGLDLSGLSFVNADLRWARMNFANLQNADLSGAALDSAWAAQADFSGAKLVGASAQSAQMPRAILAGADLSGARVVANLSRANLRGATARNANFSPDMTNQSMGLIRLQIQNADAAGADFSGANLDWADAEFAEFNGGVFTGASFRHAKLGGADFTMAKVSGMDVLGANLDSAVLLKLEGEMANLEKARKLDRAWRD